MVENKNLKEKMFEIAINFIKDNQIERDLFNQSIGNDLISLIQRDQKISQYQWIYDTNNTQEPSRNMLEDYYLSNFFKTLKIYSISKQLKNDIRKNQGFITYFEEQYDKLYEVITLPEFNYLLLIPVYGLIIDKDMEEIIFDSEHCFKNIQNVENPYYKKYGIRNYKDPPDFWAHYWRKSPKVSLEIKISFPKRLKGSPIYNGFLPPAPYITNHYQNFSIFLEKIKSIFDFFICFSDDKYIHDVLTFGEYFFTVLPAFSTIDNNITQSLMNEFPYPFRILLLNDDQNLKSWKIKWQKYYTNFYKNYYTEKSLTEDYRVLKRVLEVIRIVSKINYLDLKVFLLVATLESILYSEKNAKKIKKNGSFDKKARIGKRIPCAKIFVELCEHLNEYWQFLFSRKYPLDNKLSTFETKQDLFDFIISAFMVRNNIAHPEKIQAPKKLPISITPHNNYGTNEELIKSQTNNCFPLFLRFILKVWLGKGFTSINQWHKFLEQLL